jgi:hypothetical protein
VSAVGTSGSVPTGNDSNADNDLYLLAINNDNFAIKVIDHCGNTSPFDQSKTTFNNAYKTALINYINSNNCQTISKL